MGKRYDGKVTISTAIDNSGIEKDLREVNGEFGGLTNTVKETEKAIASLDFLGDKAEFLKEFALYLLNRKK